MVDTRKRNNFRRADYSAPKIYNRQYKEKKTLDWRPFWRLLPLVLIVTALVYFFSYSNVFQVAEIIVEGNKSVSAAELESYIERDNIFKVKTKLAEARILSDLTSIQSVKIYRGIPNAIKVVVYEREPEIVWQSNSKRYLVSSQGEVCREAGEGEVFDLPIVVDSKNMAIDRGGKIVSSSFITFILNVSENSRNIAGILVDHFAISDTTFDINLYPKEKPYYIKLNSLRSSKKQLENLALVLPQKEAEIKEYIDLRIDGWGYYK